MEKLIEEVKKYPMLYDPSDGKYRNTEYKEKVWRTIATTLCAKGGAKECKKKWSSVRDQLRRTINRRKNKSGQSASKIRKYIHEDILQFLVPFLSERESLSNVSEELTLSEESVEYLLNTDPLEHTTDFTSTSSSQHSYHDSFELKKETPRSITQPLETNLVDAFLGAIAPSLKSLSPILLHEAKGRIFEIVQELELRELQMNK
ncbi:unnamed protein product [Phyllotreta striolata]|uniref:MADF domain-containing protein n=1 Tax=Phyllotreta striolata TaxID=444603 RepID=A0A9N9TVD0_PHYSR|nr:unnamed protein product [Phyllotreta striolata]